MVLLDLLIYIVNIDINIVIVRLINQIKGKELSEDQVKKYKNRIRELSEDTTKKMEDKIKILEQLKEDIENIIKNKIKDEEIKFEGEKESLIERITLARENNKLDIRNDNNILRNSTIFGSYCENLRNSMIILNPIKKKESTDSFGKIVENI